MDQDTWIGALPGAIAEQQPGELFSLDLLNESPVLPVGKEPHSHGCLGSSACCSSSGASTRAQVQRWACWREEIGALPRQDSTGWHTMTGRPLCNPGAFERDTLIKGTQRSESTVWKALLEAVFTTQTPQPGVCLGGGVAGVGEGNRQAARDKAHMSMHTYPPNQ